MLEAPNGLLFEFGCPNARLLFLAEPNASVVVFWLLKVPNGDAPFSAVAPNGFEVVDPDAKPLDPNVLVPVLLLVEPNGDAFLSLFKLPNGRLEVLFVDCPNPDWPKPVVSDADPVDVDALPNPDEPKGVPFGALPKPDEPNAESVDVLPNADDPNADPVDADGCVLPNPVEPNAAPVEGAPNGEVAIVAGFELPKPEDPNADG